MVKHALGKIDLGTSLLSLTAEHNKGVKTADIICFFFFVVVHNYSP